MFEHQGEENTSSTSESTTTFTPFDLRDALEEEWAALHALGELLRTARLSEFDRGRFVQGSGADTRAQHLQYGLAKIIDLFLGRQEHIINRFVEGHENSDAYLLEQAERIVTLVKQGAWRPGCAGKELNKALQCVQVVAGRGGLLADRAKAIEKSIWEDDLFHSLRMTSYKDKAATSARPGEAGEVAA